MKAIGLSDGVTCGLPLNQPEMGDVLGLSTVHTNKKLRELKRERLVEVRANLIRILDWEGLCQRADFDPNYLRLKRYDE